MSELLDRQISDWEIQLAFSQMAVTVASSALVRLARKKIEETQLTLNVGEKE